MLLETFLKAIILGGIEGLTEFLPISSTGHLIVFRDILGFRGPPGQVFEVAIQLGAILAICLLYFTRLLNVLRGILHKSPASQRFALAVIISFLPAALLGVMFHGFIKAVLFSPQVVAVSLILGGIAIIAVERFKPAPFIHSVENMTPVLSLKIGIMQSLALIPGVSRSGATIVGSMLMGVDRKAATEFSFFLAIPTMVGAVTYDLWKNYATLTFDGMTVIGAGFISAFIFAWIVVRWLIKFVGSHSFILFAWYRIVFGLAILIGHRLLVVQ